MDMESGPFCTLSAPKSSPIGLQIVNGAQLDLGYIVLIGNIVNETAMDQHCRHWIGSGSALSSLDREQIGTIVVRPALDRQGSGTCRGYIVGEREHIGSDRSSWCRSTYDCRHYILVIVDGSLIHRRQGRFSTFLAKLSRQTPTWRSQQVGVGRLPWNGGMRYILHHHHIRVGSIHFILFQNESQEFSSPQFHLGVILPHDL